MAFFPPYYLIFSCLYLPLLTYAAQTTNNITLGSSLIAGNPSSQPWLSPSKEFAFGFQQVQPGNFLLAIWFDRIPEKTITWSANRDHLVPINSKLQFTIEGNLILTDPNGQIIWQAKSTKQLGDPTYGAMLDNGNFVIATKDAKFIWQSFDEPTDTLLPTQALNIGAKLISPYSLTNYSSGRFMVQLRLDGNLAFYTTNYPLFNSINTLYFSSSILSNMLFENNVDQQLYYQRVILEYDGVLRYYVYPKKSSLGSKGWSVKSFVPKNICTAVLQQTGSGVCGFNSYCQLGNDNKPYCLCPPGYTLLDPSDQFSGCYQKSLPQSCEKSSKDKDEFGFKVLINVDWPLSDYEHFENVTKDWCRDICLPDCFCAVSVFREESRECWKKKLPLSNGKNDTSVDRTTFIKVRIGHDSNKVDTQSFNKV